MEREIYFIWGRTILLNFVLNFIPVYFFSFYKAPKCVIQNIIRTQRDFLCGGDSEKRKMACISWRWVCKPNDQGGLGVKHYEMFNISLLSKWKWCILNEVNVLWSGFLSLRYEDIKYKMLDDVKLLVNINDSLWGRHFDSYRCFRKKDYHWFSNNISCKIGNGYSIDCWRNKCLGSSSFRRLFPLIFARAAYQKHKVSTMGDWVDNAWILVVKLQEDRLVQVDEDAQLESLLSILQDVQLNRQVYDSFIWWRNKHGFSVKRNYQVIQAVFDIDVQMDESIIHLFDMLWITNVPRKILIFGWRLLLNRLPTRVALSNKGVINGSHNLVCPFCFVVEESLPHLFFNFMLNFLVWEQIYKWLDMPFQFELNASGTNFNSFCFMIKGRVQNKICLLMWIAVCWAVW